MENILQKKLNSELEFLKENFNIDKIGYFGSNLTKPMNEANDIDIFVTFKKPIGFKFFDLIDYLENKLGKRVDVITKYGLNNIKNKKIKDSISNTIHYVN